MRRALSAAAVNNAKPREREYKLTDGGGLYLRVRPSGARSWYFKYRLHGRQYAFHVGPFPEVPLTRARILHDQARATVATGHHPLEERRMREASTFETVAREWMEKKQSTWSPGYTRQVERALVADVFPAIGHFPISEVSAPQLLAVIDAVATRRTPTGKKNDRGRGAAAMAVLELQLCSSVFRYAVARKLCEHDVAADLRGAVVRPRVRNHPGLKLSELPDLLRRVRRYGLESRSTSPATPIAIELLLLTFVRTAELRHATWGEIDFDQALWSIRGERMKMRRDHLVPLSPRALDLLRQLEALGLSKQWLFPNRRNPTRPMSATTINRALEYLGYGGRLSGHGFRSTASTLLHEAGFASTIIEKQLAHEQRNRVAAAYNKAEFLQQRHEMMSAWAEIVENAGTECR